MLRSRLLCGALLATLLTGHGAADNSITLPMPGKTGDELRYQATWTREIGPPDTAAKVPVKSGEQTGEIRLRVKQASTDSQVLDWLPELKLPVGGDSDPGVAIWRLPLKLALELKLSSAPQTELLSLSNKGVVAAQAADQIQALTKAAGFELDCKNRMAETVLCKLIGSPKRLTEWVMRPVAPFFACTGLTLDGKAKSEWTEAHPDPQIGDSVQIHYRRELPNFVPGADKLRIRTRAEPDAAQLKAWLDQKLGKSIHAPGELAAQLAGLQFLIETDCTIERSSGWPLRIEQRSSVGIGSTFQGADIARFERTAFTPKRD